jgi:hypothetical protein
VWRVTSKNGPENEPPQTPPEPKMQTGSTSGFSNDGKTDAVVCGGLNPLGCGEKSENTKKEMPDSINNTLSGAWVVQSTANHRTPQNGHTSKVPLDGSTSAFMALSEQSLESPICGGSFSSADSGRCPNSSCSHCGIRNWQWDDMLELYICGGCNHA